MAIKDVPVKGDVRLAVRMVKLAHPKLSVHQNPTSHQIRLRHHHRRETFHLQVCRLPTGLEAEIARRKAIVTETIVTETIHRIVTNVPNDDRMSRTGQMTRTDRRRRLKLVPFRKPPKLSEATSLTLTGILNFRTMSPPKAVMQRQMQQHHRAKDDLVGRVVADVVEGLDRKVAVSDQQRTAGRHFV